MEWTVSSVLGRFRGNALKFTSVSVIATIVSQAVIYICHAVLDWPGWLSIVIGVTVGCLPSYVLNRAWVWGKRGRDRVGNEVLIYWGMNFAGLLLSTIFVLVAEQWSDAKWVPNAANVAGFGVLWVLKFLVLDAYLFKSDHEATGGLNL